MARSWPNADFFNGSLLLQLYCLFLMAGEAGLCGCCTPDLYTTYGNDLCLAPGLRLISTFCRFFLFVSFLPSAVSGVFYVPLHLGMGIDDSLERTLQNGLTAVYSYYDGSIQVF
jgi:hypothetical protein